MFEFKEIKSENEYRLLELMPNVPFTQAWFFGEWQEAMGRKVRRFEIKNNSETLGFFQAIIYNLVFSNNFLYVPHGPILMRGPDEKFWKQYKDEVMRIAKEENAIFVRFDQFPKTEENLSKYFKKTPAYAYHSSYFQPKYEWILDLNKTEEALLGKMHPKNRYNIRLAEKRGIKIEIIKNNFEKYFEEFYVLLKETAKRDNFGLHPRNYYQNIFKTLDSENTFLTVAKYEGKTLLINLVLLYGKTSYFIFGGSSGSLKNLMFSHLAHWESIKEAKKRGINFYNFGGVDKDRERESYEGISVFKKKFGGEIFEYSDSYDLVLIPFLYFLYNLHKRFI